MIDPVEEQRKKNKEEMDARCERIAEHVASEKYPMTPDNPLYNASDDEVRAYIRKRREEFMAPGGKWDAYQAEKAEEAKRHTVQNEKR
jgi:hypothetical protein